MRSVLETPLKPEWVLSATGHSTEWISTNTRLPLPRPNQISASGNSAIAGSGLNIAVMVSRKSVPIWVEMARMEDGGEYDAGAIAQEQHFQRRPGAQRNGAVPDLVEHGYDGVVEGRKQQRIVEKGAVGLPHHRQKDDDRGLANKAVVTQQLRHAQLALDFRRIARRDGRLAAEQNSGLAHA